MNGKIAFSKTKDGAQNCTGVFEKGIANVYYMYSTYQFQCGTKVLRAESGGYVYFSDVNIKPYLKNGTNTIKTITEITGGGESKATLTLKEKLKVCPSGYTTKNDTRCHKSINYNYYSYACKDSDYSAINKGRSSCLKTDIDKDNNNSIDLAKKCNASSPGDKNCLKITHTCPIDSSKGCTYKGNKIELFTPLQKFSIDGYFKQYEYSRTRGYNCMGTDVNTNCEFGIKRIEALDNNRLCFTDMQDFTSCISYSDESNCSISGSIEADYFDSNTSNLQPIKGLLISNDRKSLLPISGNASGTITTTCMFHGKIGFRDVGLGMISVKASKNRIQFWNSYDSEQVGFLDIIPKVNEKLFLKVPIVKYKHYDLTSINSVKQGLDIKTFPKIKGSRTIVVKIKVKKDVGGRIFADDKNNMPGDYALSYRDSGAKKVRFYIRGLIPVSLDSNAVIDIDKTYYLSARFDADKMKKYLTIYDTNGKQIDNTEQDVTGTLAYSEGHASIGGESNRGTEASKGQFKGTIDNLEVFNSFLASDESKEVLDIQEDVNMPLYQYLQGKNDEVEGLIRNGFDVLYKGDDNITYMVSKDKLTISQCLSKIQNTNFDLAKVSLPRIFLSDANGSKLIATDSLKIKDAINKFCRTSDVEACDENITSNKCKISNFITSGSAMNIGIFRNAMGQLLLKMHKACEQKIFLRGLSKDSQSYLYNRDEAQYCIVESSDTKPIDFYNMKFIQEKVDNTSVNKNVYVCSSLGCNKNHICGEASCGKGTAGTLGIPSDFVGCKEQTCDYSKPFYVTCGDNEGCPQNRGIISILTRNYSAKKNIKIETTGYQIPSQRSMRSVYSNGTKIFNLSRSWNLLLFDSNYNLTYSHTFDVYGSINEGTALKNKLNAIPDGTMTILVTYDEPSTNVKNNEVLQNAMQYYGMNKDIIKNLEYRSAYLYVGEKGEKPILEYYLPPFQDAITKTVTFEKYVSKNKCYKISCPTGSILNPDTEKCEKIGCDEKSILKDGKCISKIAN